MTTSVKQSLTMGVIFTIVAMGFAIFMHVNMKGDAPLSASIVSAVGTLIVGSLLWWVGVARKQRYSIWRGLLFGMITGCFSAYFGIVGWFGFRVITESESFGGGVLSLLDVLLFSPVFTLLFLLFTHGYHVLLCSLVGVALVVYQRRGFTLNKVHER